MEPNELSTFNRKHLIAMKVFCTMNELVHAMHFPLSTTHMYFMSFFSIEYLGLKVRIFTTTLLILKSSIHLESLY